LTTQHAYPRDLSRLLGLAGEWRGEKGERKRRYDPSAYDDHAAAFVVCTAAIFRQPSILRNLSLVFVKSRR